MFLSKLLPAEGLYCVALLLQGGGFRHFFHDTLPAAQQQLDLLDRGGNTVYIAQATFDPAKIAEAQAHNKTLPKDAPRDQRKKIRGQVNALYLKNFFLDIDCGEKWPLKNQLEGAVELKKFLAETGLPAPAVVNSGNGLYAHWILEEAVPADKWRTTAFLLKQVVAQYSPALGGDASRTSDSASVLRAPGTTNRKPGRPEKQVAVIRDMDPIPFLTFVDHLERAAKRKKINCTAVQAPRPMKDLNADFYIPQGAPSDAGRIADRCAQLGKMRASGGDVIEPLWYACIGVLIFCTDGDTVVHEWSRGYPGYSQAETDSKISQWRGTGMGPTTCAKLGSENATGCIGCPYNGKIKSPIVLGRPDPVSLPVPDEECPVPDRYRRAADGLFYEEEGAWFKFYDQDLYPVCLAYDESLGYEVTVIKHHLPHEGDMECTVRSSLVNDPKALLTTLSDNHIKVVGHKEKKCMVGYLESYQARLQRQRSMTMLLCQMGWKTARNGNPMFVHGRKIFHADGKVEEASLAKNVPKAAEGFRTSGSLEKWIAATEIFDRPGMEPFAFALLAGGFGAPLMKFTGFDGALVSMVGESGAGKTMMLRMIHSVWGYHSALMMLRDDTKNAMVSRLGVYGNMPFTVDEITNIDGMELSDLVYKVTQGRDKARQTRNAEEKKLLNTWNTIAVTTSNTALIDKLSGAKQDVTAEINRIFEYRVDKNPEFEGQISTGLYWTIDENYGHAGEVYAKWLVQNIDTVKDQLDKARIVVEHRAGMEPDERFWGAVVSAAIYGGVVAQKLGLIRFSVANVLTWAALAIRDMRREKIDLTGDSIGILGQFLDAHAGNRILVKGSAASKEGCAVLEAPRGPLYVRYEMDTRLLYISRAVIKKWIATGMGSYTMLRADLQKEGILRNPNKKKTLGAGTAWGGAQQPCWEIDMTNAKLSPELKQLVEVAAALEKAPVKII